jgi:hypothetical protein
MSERIVMMVGVNIMPPEAISVVYFINHSYQQYQHWILPKHIVRVLLTSLRLYVGVSFLFLVSYIQNTVHGMQLF